jgi:bifunctional non-homologous end joining protein LigD
VPPAGDGWIHEIKHDGIRTLVLVERGRARAFSRRGLDWTARYPRILGAAMALKCRSAIIDGEAVVQDEAGRSDLAAFHSALDAEPHKVLLFAFDLLHLDGKDVRREPLEERWACLRRLIAPDPHSAN